MDSITSENPVLGCLLSELAAVFQERDDFRDEVERLTAEHGELNNLRNEVGSYAERVLDQDEEIDRLQVQYAETCEVAYDRNQRVQALESLVAQLTGELDTAKRVFDESFVHGDTGPTRSNRPKLTSADVGGIRSMVQLGSALKSAARVYGVHPSTVSRIVNGTYHRKDPK